MSPLEFTLVTFACSLAAGVLGSLLGLGGGIVVIPVLTLLLGIDIRYAIGASIVSVIATPSGAAAAYVRERMTNLRVAMFLELATTTGALSGAYLAGKVRSGWLYIIFGLVMGYSAFETRTTGTVWEGVLHLRGSSIVTAGLLLLIATPVLRVAVSIFAFVYQKDWTFVIITTVVLALLLLSFWLGKGGG